MLSDQIVVQDIVGRLLTILYASWRKTSSPSLPFPLSLARLVSLLREGDAGRDDPSAISTLNADVLSL
jgi:hypothetical protein